MKQHKIKDIFNQTYHDIIWTESNRTMILEHSYTRVKHRTMFTDTSLVAS